MEIMRKYQHREINWYLVPDLIKKADCSIPEEERKEAAYKLVPLPRFKIATDSQSVEMESEEDFVDFLKTTSEGPNQIEVRLDCYKEWPDGDLVERDPSYFSFEWRTNQLVVEMARNTIKSAIRFLEEFEQTLQLEPLKRLQASAEGNTKSRTLERTVFIAHSFDEIGRSYAYQLTKFLSLLGFEVATGEGFSPEKVSTKVKRRLLAQEIVLAIVSEREEFTWLLQEMTGANFIEKPLVALVEEGVDFKSGVLGDLEYIRFTKGRVADCFTPILEGFRELGFQFS